MEPILIACKQAKLCLHTVDDVNEIGAKGIHKDFRHLLGRPLIAWCWMCEANMKIGIFHNKAHMLRAIIEKGSVEDI